MGTSLIHNSPRYQGLRVSREEYLDLREDGHQYDMIDGVLFMSPSSDFDHGRVYGRFFVSLDQFLRKSPLGRATLETDILLPDGGDVLRPDLCLILNERMGIVKKHIHGAPDLVCEVLSESTMERDLGVKAERYLKNGVREYWILDPLQKTIELRVNAGSAWEKHSGNRLESRVLPGFFVTPGDIFD